jgi:hypothetical protein
MTPEIAVVCQRSEPTVTVSFSRLYAVYLTKAGLSSVKPSAKIDFPLGSPYSNLRYLEPFLPSLARTRLPGCKVFRYH